MEAFREHPSRSTCAPVTVIIVNWNSGRLLQQCLEALSKQSVTPSSILVVDNASTDGSIDNLRESENVTVKRADINLGFAAGNNWAIEACSTEFIALLNPDAFPAPGWLEELLNAAERSPEAAAFASRMIQHDEPEFLDGAGDAYHVTGLFWRIGHGRKPSPATLHPRPVFSACAGAALYRRQAVREAGGFDEDFFCYGEDVDLGFRLRLSGHTVLYVPKAIAYHVGGGSSGGTQSDFAAYYGQRNLPWVFLKNMPSTLMWALLPAHILVNGLLILRAMSRGQGRIVLRAKWDAASRLREVWKKRRAIQAQRRVGPRALWTFLHKGWPR
ncbi:glycosyltransferase family 2 protein [Thioalkalivibrio sp. AKL10]|uniref:glycosyltransferase family 2 protein n=1 Tax=Thioalkalivibrio sp. AKL10 TaxID=1158158 RepID=UPI0003679D93|nr:glycosyltransferase family 2 protein [Thioalkalivibrio sp. AKL10]